MMISTSRTNLHAPLLLSIALALTAGAAPLVAQRTEVTVRRTPRATTPDSSEQQLRRFRRTLDSLLRVFDDGDVNAAERARLRREIEGLVVQFKAQRMRMAAADARLRTDAPYVRGLPPDPGFGPSMGTDINMMLPTPIPQEAMARGWIGIVVSGAPTEIRLERNELLMRYLTYPEIASVDPSSPAQRAGLAPGDTLLAYDGRDVRGSEISMTRLLRPKAKVVVRVRRDGRVRDLPVIVAEAPPRIKLRRDDEIRDAGKSWVFATPPEVARVPGLTPAPPVVPSPPRMFTLPTPAVAGMAPPRMRLAMPPMFGLVTNGVAGAQLVTISDGLKRSLGLQSGVLVTTVPVGSPAGESGLEEGDVIVRVAKQPVRSVLEVRELVARAAEDGERSVELELIRGKQRRTTTLRWSR